jgi:hypothetical protein
MKVKLFWPFMPPVYAREIGRHELTFPKTEHFASTSMRNRAASSNVLTARPSELAPDEARHAFFWRWIAMTDAVTIDNRK